jgi:hypothetical protein
MKNYFVGISFGKKKNIKHKKRSASFVCVDS